MRWLTRGSALALCATLVALVALGIPEKSTGSKTPFRPLGTVAVQVVP